MEKGNMKLLLIMPRFLDYPDVIKEELENMGYEVDFFDDRPSTNAFIKAVIRINKNFLQLYIRQYFNKMMQVVNNKRYDVVLLIMLIFASRYQQLLPKVRYKELLIFVLGNLKNLLIV